MMCKVLSVIGIIEFRICAAGSRESLLLGGALPASPTAVISGSNYSSNVARLSTSQRKRLSSVDDLTALR